MPEKIHPVLSISGDDLNKIADMADKMLEITSYNNISEVLPNYNQNSQVSALTKQVEVLTKMVTQMSNNHGRSQTRDNSRNRARSSSRQPVNSPYCYYHFNYGAMARKCREPCKFKAEIESKSNNPQKN